MRIATFNANSIRVRLEAVLNWISKNQPDILCIQEIKCRNEDFPENAVREAGLYCACNGQKTYNGVALISPHPMDDIVCGTGDELLDTEARFISARIGDVLFVNTYIPQGQAIGSEKFERKLAYLDFMYSYFSHKNMQDNIIWCGDFNIAMTELDVYAPDDHWGEVGFCSEEQLRLQKIMDLGLYDTFRQLYPDDDDAFTFWDFRIRGAMSRKLGWRLDYIMASEPMAKELTASYVDREPRKQPKSSDHTFLISDFNYKL